MKDALTAIAGFAVAYFMLAFIAWEPNPAAWSDAGRFVLVWMGSGFAGIAVCIRRSFMA